MESGVLDKDPHGSSFLWLSSVCSRHVSFRSLNFTLLNAFQLSQAEYALLKRSQGAQMIATGFETILQVKPGFRGERMATLSFDGMTVIVDTSSVDSPATLGFESDDSDRDFRTVIDRGAVSIESRQPTKNGASEQGTLWAQCAQVGNREAVTRA